MKGDFSRRTFDARNHYSGVIMQQGRVLTDADWNEQLAIARHRTETTSRDVIGRCGAPADGAGFEISVISQQNIERGLFIGQGRYYVDGLLCENEATVLFEQQPYLPAAGDPLDKLEGQAIVYLEVWERHVTALDDPHIREVAPGGPDTTTRAQVIWQVKVLPVKTDGRITCQTRIQEWEDLQAPSTGTLTAHTQPVKEESACLLPPAAGYQGLENQLYRVEIHRVGTSEKATFKWSRDNGSIVTAVEQINGAKLTVRSLGRDEVSGFASGQWVELTSDEDDLAGRAGTLLRITSIDAARREITVNQAPSAPADSKRFKLRRWDQTGPDATDAGIPVQSGRLPLENGIEVEFSDGSYRTGDYWLIPARTAIAGIEWPQQPPPDSGPAAQPPLGIRRHFCRLAVLERDQAGTLHIHDCRQRFPSASAAAMHVTGISWRHDDTMPLSTLQKEGLRVTLDTVPDAASVSHGSVIVVVEMGNPGTEAAPERATPIILYGSVRLDGNNIQWQLTPTLHDFVSAQLNERQSALVRVTLKGRSIWTGEKTRIYLDGQVYSQPGKGSSTSLSFPSGAGERASDFESWFYLTPTEKETKPVPRLKRKSARGKKS